MPFSAPFLRYTIFILKKNAYKLFEWDWDKSLDKELKTECKSAIIDLDASVFDQAARYNLSLKVPYLVITNGMKHYCAEVNLESKAISHLNNIPSYKEVKC